VHELLSCAVAESTPLTALAVLETRSYGNSHNIPKVSIIQVNAISDAQAPTFSLLDRQGLNFMKPTG
jgi:hypothetical protein